jgi:hypothetical protein
MLALIPWSEAVSVSQPLPKENGHRVRQNWRENRVYCLPFSLRSLAELRLRILALPARRARSSGLGTGLAQSWEATSETGGTGVPPVAGSTGGHH